jgi:lysophospholipase L1-like esterase
MNLIAYGDSIMKGVRYTDGKYSVSSFWEQHLKDRFGINVINRSRFGCTIPKALPVIKKKSCDEGEGRSVVFLEFGGNDCDYDWKAISDDPSGRHQCKTPPEVFVSDYREAISVLRENGSHPVMLTLPPILASRYFDFICRNGNSRSNILRWLGSVFSIERWQKTYSELIQQIAREEQVDLIDLRAEFPSNGKDLERLICEDGIHPTEEGQRLISTILVNKLDSLITA